MPTQNSKNELRRTNYENLAKQGFYMPAEWEPHEAILLAWPHNPRTWPGRAAEVQETYLALIKNITTSEQVWLIVRSHGEEIEVRRRLTLANISDVNIRFFHLRNNDAWIRDYGPIYVVRDGKQGRERMITDWAFNGWGSKYQETEDYTHDDIIPGHIAKLTGANCITRDFILEGGSIDVNGCGTLITSKSCLLNVNRNSQYTQNQIEDILQKNLGVKKTIWVDDGIAGDDTDGHIDDTVRFVNPTTLVCAFEENAADENHLPLLRIHESLMGLTDQDGRPLRVVKLPMPSAVVYHGERLPASYVNFLILNTKVLVPIFNCPADETALEIFKNLFPDREVVGINACELVIGFGSLHCLSQQVPMGKQVIA